MSSVVLTGDTSGSGTLTVPAVAGTFTATLGSATGTHYPFTAGTAVASTSGTSIDFTSIPSWVKRITVLMLGISTSGTSSQQVQIGAGSVTTSGYTASAWIGGSSDTGTTATSGFLLIGAASVAADSHNGQLVISNITGNTWVASGTFAFYASNGKFITTSMGSVALGGTLDRIRITTVNGTDTFDAGSINILME
jgi:hypothetical protein